MRKEYILHGLDCIACADELERAIEKIKGVQAVSISFTSEKMILKIEDDTVLKKVFATINEMEPNVVIDKELENDQEGSSFLQLIKIFSSLVLFLIGILYPFKVQIIRYVFLFVSYGIIGLEIVIKAIKNLIKGKVMEENFLMSVATIGAILIGEFPEAVAVMLFYQIGEFFQDWAVDQSKRHIKNLMDIRPDYANVWKNKKWEKVSPNEVSVGDIILVKPGEKIPLDGVIKKGESFLDTTALTGESVPSKVKVGTQILNGCVNKTGNLEIEVTCNYSESTVSKILNLVENASNNKANHEKFITKFSKVYTPIVVGLAFIIAVFPPLIIHESFQLWLYRALSFLVISCPCALVISIPLSFFAGIGVAAHHGILIKGSNYLESLVKVKNIVFDKTGTLTEGVFCVQKIITKGMDKDKLLEMVAQLEYYSNHPIALSIKEYYGKEINIDKLGKIEELSGLGISGTINKNNILVGNNKLMEKYHIEYESCEEIGTVLYVAINKKHQGTIIISDKVKEDSINTIHILQDYYNVDTIMLTGDKEIIAKNISHQLGVNQYYSELLPNDKVIKLEELMKNKMNDELVAFVGDGMNDAPALALSDLGIAMGGIGSDAAIEAADIVIMKDEISKIITVLNISYRTLKIARENIIFAITIKIVVLLLSLLGIATMWSAVFADVGVSVLAILNSLRLLRMKFN